MDSTLRSDAVSSGNQTNNDQEPSSKKSKKKNKRRNKNRIDESGQNSQLKDSQSTDLPQTSNLVNCFSEDVDSSKKLKTESVEDEESEPETFETFQKFNSSQPKRNKFKPETCAEVSQSTSTTERIDSSTQSTNSAIIFNSKAGKSCPKFPPAPCNKKPVLLGPPPVAPGFKKTVSTVVEKQNSENCRYPKTKDRDNDSIHAVSEPTPALSGSDSQNAQKSSANNHRNDKIRVSSASMPAQCSSDSQNIQKSSSKNRKKHKIHTDTEPASEQSGNDCQNVRKTSSKDRKRDNSRSAGDPAPVPSDSGSRNVLKSSSKYKSDKIPIANEPAPEQSGGGSQKLSKSSSKKRNSAGEPTPIQSCSDSQNVQKFSTKNRKSDNFHTARESTPAPPSSDSQIVQKSFTEDRRRENVHTASEATSAPLSSDSQIVRKSSIEDSENKIHLVNESNRTQGSSDSQNIEKPQAKGRAQFAAVLSSNVTSKKGRGRAKTLTLLRNSGIADSGDGLQSQQNSVRSPPKNRNDESAIHNRYTEYENDHNLSDHRSEIVSDVRLQKPIEPNHVEHKPDAGTRNEHEKKSDCKPGKKLERNYNERSKHLSHYEKKNSGDKHRSGDGNNRKLEDQRSRETYQQEKLPHREHSHFSENKSWATLASTPDQSHDKLNFWQHHSSQNGLPAMTLPITGPPDVPLSGLPANFDRSRPPPPRCPPGFEIDPSRPPPPRCPPGFEIDPSRPPPPRCPPGFENQLVLEPQQHPEVFQNGDVQQSYANDSENPHKDPRKRRSNRRGNKHQGDHGGDNYEKSHNDESHSNQNRNSQREKPRNDYDQPRRDHRTNYAEKSRSNKDVKPQSSNHDHDNSHQYSHGNHQNRGNQPRHDGNSDRKGSRGYHSHSHQRDSREYGNKEDASRDRSYKESSRFSNADPKFSSKKSKNRDTSVCTCEKDTPDNWENGDMEYDTSLRCAYCQARFDRSIEEEERINHYETGRYEREPPQSRSKRAPPKQGNKMPLNSREKSEDNLWNIVAKNQPGEHYHHSLQSRSRPNIKKSRNKQPLFVPGAEHYEPVIREIQEDLFQASEEYSLAHCVAADLQMGAGIAVGFRKIFGGVQELLDQDKGIGEVAVLQRKGRYIFYLITKEWSNGKPTMQSITRAIMSLRQCCDRYKVQKLAIPRIGCGLDRLDWNVVKDVLYDIFQDSGIEILVHVV